jgi:hypothetical protein
MTTQTVSTIWDRTRVPVKTVTMEMEPIVKILMNVMPILPMPHMIVMQMQLVPTLFRRTIVRVINIMKEMVTTAQQSTNVCPAR